MAGTRVAGLALVVVLGGLAACASPRGDASVDPTQAACQRVCNRDYDVCGDAGASRRAGAPGFGGSATCERQLRSCLNACKAVTPARPAKPAESLHPPAGKS